MSIKKHSWYIQEILKRRHGYHFIQLLYNETYAPCLNFVLMQYRHNRANMKQQTLKHLHASTILAFILIPLSGLSTDIYLPSLPSMAHDFHVPIDAVQLSLLIFMFSSGCSQLFAGSLLDSFGRYNINIGALILFSTASFLIAAIPDIHLLYTMRAVQGISASLIIVGKRAFFADVYQGKELRQYTSSFSIVWATAPIIAPFIGGYLQKYTGWQANFYLLGILTTVLLLFELYYSGESLKNFQPFQARAIAQVYRNMFRTADFTLGLLIIGLSYSLLVIFGMASPFIIEKRYGLDAVATGYSSLASGVALMGGGLLSKLLITRPLFERLKAAIAAQVIIAIAMWLTTRLLDNFAILISFTLGLHLIAGFIFNSVFAYCLQRFNHHAGTASGITGSGIYVVSSTVGYGVINLVNVRGSHILSSVNLLIVLLLMLTLIAFKWATQRAGVPTQLLFPLKG